jgi:hypothetical protein
MKGLTLKASPSAATACYVAHLVSKRHAGKPTDYFAALTEARQKAEMQTALETKTKSNKICWLQLQTKGETHVC